MNSIRFHCGNFERFAFNNEYYLLITQGTKTDKKMSEAGYDLLGAAEIAPITVFCNNENTFNGLRRAIVERNFDTDPDVEVIFYPDEDERQVAACPVDRNGRIKLWPRDMFDQVSADLCAIINGASRNKKANAERRENQNQDTATETS